MRVVRSGAAALPLALTCAVLTASAKEPPRQQQAIAAPERKQAFRGGIRGALLGEDARAVAPRRAGRGVAFVDTEDQLARSVDYLRQRKARKIEDLTVEDLRRTVIVPAEQKEQVWRVRLGQLAHDELARRGVINEPFPSPAQPEPLPPRPPMSISAAGLEIMARIVKGETWFDGPHEGEVAVASVILNRVRAKGFPKTIAGVCHQPWQFSCYNDDVRDQLYWGPIRSSALQAAKEAAAGQDPVNGATHYFNPYLVTPSWAKTLHFVKRIGDDPRNTHDFYK